ncbi:hypothetical protein NP233_g80 [Leucocoprinus birnbaumii]|uniref:Uncharacterized protein n=1 Tax=Leucocoprinus birnbaumii TaxID=56174 RepID=A0AAD5YYV0_9AGAR|nr:hypothetical protein NP233_g80 [Leucocoprinus birnbaumii]
MPTIPLRQRLFNGALKYAQRLQTLRRQELEDDSSEGSTSASESDQAYRSDSSLSSLSSLASVSSVSSLSSMERPDTESHHGLGLEDRSESDVSSDEEMDLHYSQRLAAVRAHIQYLTDTRVLEPNRVHKLSQLYLVLVLYKKYDTKRFRKNLRVAPDTATCRRPFPGHFVHFNPRPSLPHYSYGSVLRLPHSRPQPLRCLDGRIPGWFDVSHDRVQSWEDILVLRDYDPLLGVTDNILVRRPISVWAVPHPEYALMTPLHLTRAITYGDTVHDVPYHHIPSFESANIGNHRHINPSRFTHQKQITLYGILLSP